MEILPVSFNRIENRDHTFRSPKIKTGGRDAVSVVTFIRDKAKEGLITTKWYLFWFGLESEQPVFFLFNNDSKTFNDIVSIGVELNENVKSRLEQKDPE